MGIISGILQIANSNNNLTNVLADMLAVQSHRDKSKPVVSAKPGFAFGMANSHNGRNSSMQSNAGIFVFVDGIVLETKQQSLCDHILSAYQKWGQGFMNHLEGEFACAVWDNKENILILARDPYGHKPLHYYMDHDKFLFSSEIKGLLAAGIPKEIDLNSLSEFLSLNCVPYPGTIFKGVKQVPPGCLAIIKDDTLEIRPYWRAEITEDNNLALEDAVVLMTDSIRSAVRKRMVKDETYCFLSGGIDSSALVSFAAELSPKKINAITVSFDEKEVDELEDAKIMAKHVGAHHIHVTAKPDSFFEMLDTLVFHHDSPFTDTSAYPSYYAGKLGREFTNLILTGDGPDQTMGGSGHHVFALQNDQFRNRNIAMRSLARTGSFMAGLGVSSLVPSLLAKAQRSLYRKSLTPIKAAYDLRSFFPDIVKKHLCNDDLWRIHCQNNPYKHPESWFQEAGQVGDINKYLYADVKFYVTDDLMIKVDRMCMAHGLETLSPFQDIELAKVVNRLPDNFKINTDKNGKVTTKYILKKVCEKRFPAATLNKKKQGFGIPIDKWLRQKDGENLKAILLDSKTLNRGYFKKEALTAFVKDYISNKGDYYYPNSSGIVALLTLELWHRKYLD